MSKIQQDDERLSDGVNLLVSILVCFPEIATIKFESAQDLLGFRLMVRKVPDAPLLAALKTRMISSIKTFNMLLDHKNIFIDFSFDTCEHMGIITITRDVKSISRGEIALIITIMHDAFKDVLISDTNDSLHEEDLILQEELIDNMLDRLTQQPEKPNLIGIREDGRVLVFNK